MGFLAQKIEDGVNLFSVTTNISVSVKHLFFYNVQMF